MKKSKLLYILITVVFPSFCYSQSQQVYQTKCRVGIYSNGIFYKDNPIGLGGPIGGINFGLTAFDSNATSLYKRNYGGIKDDRVFNVESVIENGIEYLLWGGSSSSFHVIPPNFGITHAYLIKTNTQLDTIWTKFYDQSTIRKIVFANDSNYLATTSNNRGQIIKINKLNGDTIWSNNIDFTTSGQPHRMTFTGSLLVNADSCLFIGGVAYPVSNAKILLTKTDTIGNPIWMKAYGDTSSNAGWDGVMCHDNGFALVGQTGPTGGLNPVPHTYNDFLLIRTDNNGILLWCKSYATNYGVDIAMHVLQTTDLGFAILGTTETDNIIDTIKTMLIKTDSLGNVEWVKSYNAIANGGSIQLFSFRNTDQGGFIGQILKLFK